MLLKLLLLATVIVAVTWWSRRAPTPARPGPTLAVTEAAKILGVAPNASEEEVVAAHRRLIRNVHPDRGGSDYLARQINDARDVLLDRLR